MRYVEARLEEHDREETYRIYVTRSLQIAPKGESLVKSYSDFLNPESIDTRSGNEIAADVIVKAGLKFG